MSKHDKKSFESWKEENGIKMKGMTVKVKNPDSMGRAISELKKRFVDEGLAKELRQREYYESKGQRKRREKAEAIRRFKREQSKLED